MWIWKLALSMSFLPHFSTAEIPADIPHSLNQSMPPDRAQQTKNIFPTSPGFVFQVEETQLSN